MNRFARVVMAIAAMVAYLSALRYVAPSDKPYFIMGIGLVGLVAWLLGTVQGVAFQRQVLLVHLHVAARHGHRDPRLTGHDAHRNDVAGRRGVSRRIDLFDRVVTRGNRDEVGASTAR